ncbi:hypothetical protein NLI96_g5671 [Meripilus lineatus]|uniref:DUF6534 domain-containing protein n=1 Tax=Meripilus lineatus TaxID=2056292 RepID=A0AAD5V4Q0_9APHY|nr:hypothetical protein NLI96_g5671 [Physisporinus lineatus]
MVIPRTQTVIRTLIIYAINTGALTSLSAISCLIAFAASPSTPIFQVFYLILPELYLNSLLATLNARKKLRQHNAGSTSDHLSFPLTPVQGPVIQAKTQSYTATQKAIDIRVESEVVTDQEKGPELVAWTDEATGDKVGEFESLCKWVWVNTPILM